MNFVWNHLVLVSDTCRHGQIGTELVGILEVTRVFVDTVVVANRRTLGQWITVAGVIERCLKIVDGTQGTDKSRVPKPSIARVVKVIRGPESRGEPGDIAAESLLDKGQVVGQTVAERRWVPTLRRT